MCTAGAMKRTRWMASELKMVLGLGSEVEVIESTGKRGTGRAFAGIFQDAILFYIRSVAAH